MVNFYLLSLSLSLSVAHTTRLLLKENEDKKKKF